MNKTKMTQIRSGHHWGRLVSTRRVALVLPVLAAVVSAATHGHLGPDALASAAIHPLDWRWG